MKALFMRPESRYFSAMASTTVKVIPAKALRDKFPTVDPANLGLYRTQTLALYGLDVEIQEVYVAVSTEQQDFPWVNPDAQYGPAPRFSDQLSKDEVAAAEWLDAYPALEA